MRAGRERTGGKEPLLPSSTTVKVSCLVAAHIEKKSLPRECVDDTLRRLLNMSPSGRRDVPCEESTILRVSRDLSNHIFQNADVGESKDDTLRRLLGLRRNKDRKERS